MAYARLDDRWDDHRKIRRAWRQQPAAVALHAMAITYCNRHNTDGHIESDWLEEKLELLPFRAAQRTKVVVTLLEADLFEQLDDNTFRVHDYLDWNRSREERAELSERGRRGGLAKAKPRLEPPPSRGQSRSHSPGSSGGLSTPRHVKREAEASPSEASKHPEAARLSQLLADTILENEPKASVHPLTDRWVRDMRLLLADRGGDQAEVERIIDWCQADSFWRSNILSPGKLRAQFTQLALKASADNVRHLPSAVPEHLRSTPEHDAQIRAHLEAQREGA